MCGFFSLFFFIGVGCRCKEETHARGLSSDTMMESGKVMHFV